MHKRFIILLFLLTTLLSAADEQMVPAHKEWLDLVNPIMTKTEKDVFSRLKSTREREQFIRLFWKRRDPLPDTEANEFQDEYMERVRYADRHFGRSGVKRGSRTDRGFFYLLLGPPLDRQSYATQSQIWPLELWHYKGEQQYGLPAYFYLIFFQPEGLGEYKLYSPGVDGPERLMIPGMAEKSLTRQVAYQSLKNISGELAAASLTYLPGENPGLSTSSLSSNTVIANVGELAEKKFNDAYARHFLYYNEFVETEYTHDYINCDSQVKIFESDGQPFIHWSIEPDKLNMSSHDGNYYASIQVVLRLEDRAGGLVYEKEENIPITITPEERERFERRPMAFQDMLPAAPGDYKIFLLLQNRTAKNFTSFDTVLHVPGSSKNPTLSPLLLYQSSERLNPEQQGKLKAFTFDGTQYVFSSRNSIPSDQPAGVFGQVAGLDTEGEYHLDLQFYNLDRSEYMHSIELPLRSILQKDGKGIDTGFLDLKQLPPGYYRVDVNLTDKNSGPLSKQTINFILMTRAASLLPRVFSKLHPRFPHPEHLETLASQYFMSGRYDQARDAAEKRLQMQDSLNGRLLLSRIQFGLQNYEEALRLSIPIYRQTFDREAGKTAAASYAALNNWSEAVVLLEDLLKEAQEIPVLNLAGECYLKLNQIQRALPFLQKSLQLNPDQPAIRELLKEAERKKQPDVLK
ncbi:MAG: GWxTD domain-containing protein [Acidobacteria bacterium]|nr:GWxTD domain-containing protein [Acidobacteriota bacterium]